MRSDLELLPSFLQERRGGGGGRGRGRATGGAEVVVVRDHTERKVVVAALSTVEKGCEEVAAAAAAAGSLRIFVLRLLPLPLLLLLLLL